MPLIVASVVFVVLLVIAVSLLMPPEEPSPPAATEETRAPETAVTASMTGPAATKTAAATRTAAAATTTASKAATTTAAPAKTPATKAQQKAGEQEEAAGRPKDSKPVGQAGVTKPEAPKPPTPKPAESRNAADCYLKAFEQLVVGKRKVMARLERAAKEGYQGGDKRLERLVAENQPALDALLLAARRPKCDFGKTTRQQAAERRNQAQSLALIALARARMLEADGRPNDALALAAAAVRLSTDIRRPASLDSLETGQALLAAAFPVMLSLLEQGGLTAGALRSAAAALRRACEAAPSVSDAVAADIAPLRTEAAECIQSPAYLKGGAWRPPFPPSIRQAMLGVALAERAKFADAVMLEFDKRCMRMLEIVEKGDPASVRAYAGEMARALVQAKTPGFGRKPAQTAAYLAARFLPQVEPLWRNHAYDRLRAGALLMLAGARLYQREHAAWPASLADLTSEIAAKPAVDPFDPARKPLRYKVVGVDVALWSVGPDGKDDAAASPNAVGSPEKDIVYWLHRRGE